MSFGPLRYPPLWDQVVGRHFLLGIPILGPQASVYRSVVAQLAARDETCWQAWNGSPRRLEVARFAAARIGVATDWPNPIFLPDDPFDLVAWNHNACAVDDLGIAHALAEIERWLGTRLHDREWEPRFHSTFGEVVDWLIAASELALVRPASGAGPAAADSLLRPSRDDGGPVVRPVPFCGNR